MQCKHFEVLSCWGIAPVRFKERDKLIAFFIPEAVGVDLSL
jgi:hypothetical protein